MKHARLNYKLVLAGIGLLSLTCCVPPTTLTRSWSDPSVSNGEFKPFKKVLVIARFRDATTQHIGEDRIVSEFKPGVAIPSYNYLSTSDSTNSAILKRLKNDGFDGVVLMRLTDVRESVNVQSTGGMYGPYGYGYGYGYGYPAYNNTTVSVDKTFYVETCIFSLPSNKLIWSGTTSTFEPSSFSRALDEIITANKTEMIKRGLLKQP